MTLFALAQPGVALTIDDFESGPFDVQDDLNGPSSIRQQSGLPTSSVVGGVRLLTLTASGSGNIGFGRALLEDTVGDDGVAITSVGTDTTTSFAVIYDGIPDNAGNGPAGALDLNMSSTTEVLVSALGTGVSSPTVSLRMFNGSGSLLQTSAQVLNIGGLTSIDLTGFSASALADIRTIRLDFVGFEIGDAFSISNIDAPNAFVVPEPGTGLLMGLGLVGLAARRRAAAGLDG